MFVGKLIALFTVFLFLAGCVDEMYPHAQTIEAAARIPSMCGRWFSVTSQKTYEFRRRGGGAFDVYELRYRQWVPIGDGMQIDECAVASINIQIGTQERPGTLNLCFRNANELVGDVKGIYSVEHGLLRFLRQR